MRMRFGSAWFTVNPKSGDSVFHSSKILKMISDFDLLSCFHEKWGAGFVLSWQIY